MKRSKFSEEQIVYAIRQAEAGTPVGDLCRQLGVSDATFYAWKKKYAHLGVSKLQRLRQLEEENSWLKRLLAELLLDKHRLSEVLRKKSTARTPSGTGRLVSRDVSGQLPAGLPVGPIQSSRLVSTESSQGSVGPQATHLRRRPRQASVWLSANQPSRRSNTLAGEPKTHPTTTVSARWLATAHAGAATQAHRTPSWPGPDPKRSHRALEQGFCA
jgi:putative transposase